MPGTSKCSPALRACEWQHSALHGASMHRSHPQSGGDLALGCEPESKGIADISVSCDGLFDVGSAGVRRGAFIHAVARALATLAPSSWPTASEIVRLASRVFPECPVAAAVSFLIWGRIEGGARCAQTDASWFGARWGDVYQHVGDDTGLGRMVRLRLPRLRLLRSARVQPYVQLRLHPASLSRFSAGLLLRRILLSSARMGMALVGWTALGLERTTTLGMARRLERTTLGAALVECRCPAYRRPDRSGVRVGTAKPRFTLRLASLDAWPQTARRR